MASPIFEQGLTLKDVLELSADELREELAGREIDSKEMSKVEMQKAFRKILFPVVPVAPVVTQPVSPRTALSPQQQMEFDVLSKMMYTYSLFKGSGCTRWLRIHPNSSSQAITR